MMIYISIGSNVGNRLANIQKALQFLKKYSFKIIHQSPIIETPALLKENAPSSWDKPYFNMVIAGTTQRSPQELCQQLKNIEKEMGRENPDLKWAPRIIDLDILLFNNECLNEENLKIPHHELLNRPFLIHLLSLLAPEIKHPLIKKNFTEISHQQTQTNLFNFSIVAKPQLVGVVNITPDSFSDGGHFFNPANAVSQTLKLHDEGASIIELGAQSTRPKAILETSAAEYSRLKPVLDELTLTIKEKNLRVSVDSFYDETILKILQYYPIEWINDVKGCLKDNTLAAIADSKRNLVIMHSLTIPPDKDNIIPFNNPIDTIKEWAVKKIEHLLKLGFNEDQIIIDPGIGFSKTPIQNLFIIKECERLKSLGVKICIGHSRKSFINLFNKHQAPERDLETIAISTYLARKEIDYLRVHNVADHHRALAVSQALENISFDELNFFGI